MEHGTRSTTTEAYVQAIRSSFFDFALGESGGETFGVSQGQSFFAATEGCIV